MDYLYHGSTVSDIKILEPRKRYTPANKIEFEAIYASPNPGFAIAHSFPWTSNEGFDVETRTDTIELIVPKVFKDRLDVPVYLYKVLSEKFIHTKEERTGLTYHSIEPVTVVEVKGYESVEAAMKDAGGVIKYR